MTFVRWFVCAVCGEEFELVGAVGRPRLRVAFCPCCGSVELEPVEEMPDPAPGRGFEAA